MLRGQPTLLVLGRVVPSGTVGPTSPPPAWATTQLDSASALATAGPVAFSSTGSAIRIHLHTVVDLVPNTAISNAVLVDLYYRLDGAAPVLCAAAQMSNGHTGRDYRTILCETVLTDVAAGAHELAFEVQYQGTAPVFLREELSLVTVEEVTVPSTAP